MCFNLYFLPVAKVKAGAVPPVESKVRVQATGAMQCIQKRTPAGIKTRLITDGAKLYPKLAAELGIPHHSCAHFRGLMDVSPRAILCLLW